MPENDANPGEEKLLILPLGEESKKITQVISNDTARQIIELLADAPLSASDIAERLHVPLTTIVYNLENLESVGLIKIEKIKYSEKGREVKIYAPVRKLIVVVPEKTDRKSVTDLLRKYIGVLLAAVFASSLIEFFTRRTGNSAKMTQAINDDLTSAPVPRSAMPLSNATDVSNSVANGTSMISESYQGTVATPAATPASTVMDKAVSPPMVTEPTFGGALNASATATPPSVPPSISDSGTISNAAPDTFTRIADAISSHPGIVFLIGCLFVILLLGIMDYRKRRKND